MPTFRTTRKVTHAPEQMFNLVADVEAYPSFVPLCQELKIRNRLTKQDGTEIVTAQMQVGYRAVCERFTSRVTLDAQNLQILVDYVDGPFRTMDNRWSFKPDGNGGCVVEFYIAYEFRSAMLGMLMGTMFDRAFRKFAEAFEARANLIYRRVS